MHLIALFLAHLLALYLISAYLISLLLKRWYTKYFHIHPNWRIATYLSSILIQGLSLLLLIIICLGLGWSPQTVGLRLPINTPLAILFIGVMIFFIVSIAKLTHKMALDPDISAMIQQHLQYASFLPYNPGERLPFIVWCWIAGISEELLFRGFLPLYLTTIFPKIPFWATVLLSASFFGLGHLSQNKANAILAGISGFMASLCYALIGSLFPLIIVHALFDMRNIILVLERTKLSVAKTE